MLRLKSLRNCLHAPIQTRQKVMFVMFITCAHILFYAALPVVYNKPARAARNVVARNLIFAYLS